MSGLTGQDQARAARILRWALTNHLSAAIQVHGYGSTGSDKALAELASQARSMGFATAVAAGRDNSTLRAPSPLLDALASVVETRPQQKPLLLGIDRLNSEDVFTTTAIRFMSQRLALEPIVWAIVFEPESTSGAQLICGPAAPVLSKSLPEMKVPSQDSALGRTLTPAELHVAKLVCGGDTNAAIARMLGVSTHTVNTHLRAVYQKMQVRSRVQLVNAMRAPLRHEDVA